MCVTCGHLNFAKKLAIMDLAAYGPQKQTVFLLYVRYVPPDVSIVDFKGKGGPRPVEGGFNRHHGRTISHI